MFEVLTAKGTEGGREALELIDREMLADPDVRLHWVLNLDRMSSENADLRRMYPR